MKERRNQKANRNSINIDVECSFDQKKTWHRAQMKNISVDGSCIKVAQSPDELILQENSHIFIKTFLLEKNPNDTLIGNVRWVNKNPDETDIGIKYVGDKIIYHIHEIVKSLFNFR